MSKLQITYAWPMRIARLILSAEPFLLLVTGYYFWFPSNFPFFAQFGRAMPIDRADYMGLLLLLFPVYAARYAVHRRILSLTPLIPFMLLLVALGLLSVQVAPVESRGIRMLARPLFGVALMVWMTERARADGHAGVPLRVMVGMGLFWGVVALMTAQWNEKSDDLRFIIDYLPRLDWFPFGGGFNANEIAGALAWLAPLMGGLVFYPWRNGESIWRNLSFAAFALLVLALMLGQSRSAIAGMFGGLAIIALFALPRGFTRWFALAGLGIMLMAQAALFFNVFPLNVGTDAGETVELTVPTVNDRDERTASQRLDIWRSVGAMLADYPLTGVGMDRFRSPQVRTRYPVPGFDVPYNEDDPFTRRTLPHAHNEFLQAGADFGVPGLLMFAGWYAAALWMVWVCWRRGNYALRIAAVSTGAGLLAHLAYGMGDAITLWDRFAFLFWMMLGLVSALWIVLRAGENIDLTTQNEEHEDAS